MAEDAAQEAFIRAWKHLPKYQPRSPFRNWLYRIATNAALDTLRRDKETVILDDRYPSPKSNPEAALEKSELNDRIRQAILALPPSSRAVLVLREYEEMSYREIADTMGIPLGTVMSRLNYARKILRQSLATCLEEQ